jgi:hypothetical protein
MIREKKQRLNISRDDAYNYNNNMYIIVFYATRVRCAVHICRQKETVSRNTIYHVLKIQNYCILLQNITYFCGYGRFDPFIKSTSFWLYTNSWICTAHSYCKLHTRSTKLKLAKEFFYGSSIYVYLQLIHTFEWHEVVDVLCKCIPHFVCLW